MIKKGGYLMRTDARWALDSMNQTIEYIEELLPQHNIYNMGTVLNALHYANEARDCLKRLDDAERL